MKNSFKKYLQELNFGLEYHDRLNPALWDSQDRLYPDVRTKLLAYGKAFQAFGHIPDQIVKDIVMVGGNAGYNYSPFSDIDVHVIIDKALVGAGLIVDQYLKSLKLLWSSKHNITVKGYSLEPYFQDQNEVNQSSGVYSLLRNEWVQKPTHDDSYGKFDSSKELDSRIEHYQKLIDHLIDSGAGVERFTELKKKLSNLRKDGLVQGGEFSLGNLVFKGLRNSGYLDKMTKHMIDTVDKQLSL